MNAKVELVAVNSEARLLGQNQGQTQEDPIFELLQAFRKDQRAHKIDLGIGVYRDHLNRSPVFEAIKHAEQWRVDNESDKAYVGPLGDIEFCQAIAQLAFGDVFSEELSERCSYAQTPGGVGALRLAFELLEQSLSRATLWVSDMTWQVHRPIAAAAGLVLRDYRYYRADEGAATFDQLLASLEQAAPGDGILLQVSCHNPTGLDLTEQQWQRLAQFCLDRQLFPILDMAYHGLGQGLAGDRRGLEIMAEAMPELLLCYTCSKNFGLYRDRTGMVLALTESSCTKGVVDKQWAQLATRHYFTPPAHGATLVKRILNDSHLRAAWEMELKAISGRIGEVRQQLFEALTSQVPARDWQFLTRGHGMFALFPLSPAEISALREEHGLYIVNNGRVNLSGFNPLNLSRAIEAMVAVLA